MSGKRNKKLRKLARDFCETTVDNMRANKTPPDLSVFAGFPKEERKKIAKEIARELETYDL